MYAYSNVFQSDLKCIKSNRYLYMYVSNKYAYNILCEYLFDLKHFRTVWKTFEYIWYTHTRMYAGRNMYIYIFISYCFASFFFYCMAIELNGENTISLKRKKKDMSFFTKRTIRVLYMYTVDRDEASKRRTTKCNC